MRLSKSLLTQPIRYLDFENILRAQLNSVWSEVPKQRLYLGMGVSGGVDSMAMATLCKMFVQSRPYNCNCIAFVVDHGARKGSAEEARSVAKYLNSKGIDAETLTLEWPLNTVPRELPDFETQARRLRYQALAKACNKHRIRTLLLAHHEDDQAETVLLRLTHRYDGIGLRGMLPVTNVPECYDTYGVNQSGWPILIERRLANPVKSLLKVVPGLNGIERGGIKICRPLLTFSKDQLMATCETREIQWFEDKTNQERTLTPRNAIRYMMKSNLLPSAFTKESLLKVAAKINARTLSRDGAVEERFERTKFQLDLRTGQLIIQRLPDLLPYLGARILPPEGLDRRRKDSQYLAIRLLQRLISLITPQKAVPLKDLEKFVPLVFPQLWEQKPHDADVPGFTVGGVQLLKSVDARECEDVEINWTLHRQPMNEEQRVKLIVQPPPSSDHTSPANNSSVEISSWILWDGRYWIRLRGRELEKYRIRTFEPADQEKYMNGLHDSHRQWLNRVFRSHAKGKVKWTLPVIAKIEHSRDGDVVKETSRVVAFPTIGSKLPPEPIRWNVNYKQIDLGKRQLDVLDPPFDLVRLNSAKPKASDNEDSTTRPTNSGEHRMGNLSIDI